MNLLAPSILSADFTRLGDAIRALDESPAEYVHVDVMDGMFVPNISFGFPVMKSIRPLTKKTFDVHLMVQDGDRYIDAAAEAGADLICLHIEAVRHPQRALSYIHSIGKKAALALCPHTPISELTWLEDQRHAGHDRRQRESDRSRDRRRSEDLQPPDVPGCRRKCHRSWIRGF